MRRTASIIAAKGLRRGPSNSQASTMATATVEVAKTANVEDHWMELGPLFSLRIREPVRPGSALRTLRVSRNCGSKLSGSEAFGFETVLEFSNPPPRTYLLTCAVGITPRTAALALGATRS